MSKKLDTLWHLFLYTALFLGGVAFYLWRFDMAKRFEVLVLLVAFYLLWGFAYHHTKGDATRKILLEYLMIALIALGAGFLVLVS